MYNNKNLITLVLVLTISFLVFKLGDLKKKLEVESEFARKEQKKAKEAEEEAAIETAEAAIATAAAAAAAKEAEEE
ncbi:unnamed protein product, partial [marine sediment metagenome]